MQQGTGLQVAGQVRTGINHHVAAQRHSRDAHDQAQYLQQQVDSACVSCAAGHTAAATAVQAALTAIKQQQL